MPLDMEKINRDLEQARQERILRNKDKPTNTEYPEGKYKVGPTMKDLVLAFQKAKGKAAE